MKVDEIVDRLVLIKTLYRLGLEQSKRSKPFCWFCVLTFHDTIELFLELVAEHLGVSKQLRDLKFSKYWDIITPELKQIGKGELTQRIQMEKLNEARTAFKHHGTPPSTSIIEKFRVDVTNFLEENTFSIFEVKFAEVSLIDLIQCKEAKTNLNEAKRLLQKGRKEDAIDKIVIAFHQLVDDYENRKRDSYGRSPFFSSYLYPPTLSLEDSARALNELQENMKILILGLDFRKCIRFKSLTARAILKPAGGNNYIIQRLQRRYELSNEDIEYCIDFVIESAIVLQESDFELRPTKLPSLKDAY